jgi:hypothetical protein
MQQTAIHVRHLNARYVVTHQAADTFLVQQRLDRIARDLLGRQLEQCFASLNDAGGAFYFIKHMQVNAALDLGWDDAALARAWAEAVRNHMLRTISRGGSQVKIFRDRAEYVTNFIEDLLRGLAWGQWYYRTLEPLRTLPAGRAIVSVLTEERDAGRVALLELTRRGSLDALLAALSDAEAEEAVNTCLLPQSRSVLLSNMFEPWVQALRRALRTMPLSESIARDVARLYLNILRTNPELGPDVNLARFIRDVLGLRQSARGAQMTKRLLKTLRSGDAEAALLRIVGRAEGELLSPLVQELGGPEVASLLDDLGVEESRDFTRSVSTRYGGVFLLATAVAEMDLNGFLQNSAYAEPAFASKAGLFVYLMALQCLGLDNARIAMRDGGLLQLAGLSIPPNDVQLKQYCEGLTASMHEEFSSNFQARRSEMLKRTGFVNEVEATGEHEWFSLFDAGAEGDVLRGRELDRALVPVSRAVLRAFASRLGAFADSSAEYLSRNFLECHAEILVSGERITIRFLTCPLQMVLRMAGFDHRTWELPWLGGRQLEFRFD